MKEKRNKHAEVIEKFRTQHAERENVDKVKVNKTNAVANIEEADEQEINKTFSTVVVPKKRQLDVNYADDSEQKNKKNKKKKKQNNKDTDNYIPYQSIDKHTEDGLAIDNFEHAARNAEFSVIDRNQSKQNGAERHKPGLKRWDRIKKKMVSVQDPRIGKIRTESGAWISASFKTGRYNTWKEKSKIEEQLQREAESDDENAFKLLSHEKRYPVGRYKRHLAKIEDKKRAGGTDKEIRNPEQIVKQRMRLEFIKKRNIENAIRKQENRKRSMRKTKRNPQSQPKGKGQPKSKGQARGNPKAGKGRKNEQKKKSNNNNNN